MSSSFPNKTCIIIAGPTAVGKTAVSIAVAQHFRTAIISADSRQCYKELNIGVAKPSAAQLHLVQHYFINSHSVAADVNAGLFEEYALNAANEIFMKHDVVVMVGGTGLYIRAFSEGMDPIPRADTVVRNNINTKYNDAGLAWLQKEIKDKDPAWFAVGEIQNPQRTMRALEVIMQTGRSILSFQQAPKPKRFFNIIKIGLTLPRAILYQRINTRVDEMLNAGLEKEVRALTACRGLNALQTVGYREMFEYLDGGVPLDVAIENIKRNTRQYAKRQLTWFGKDKAMHWYSPLDFNQLINYLHNLV